MRLALIASFLLVRLALSAESGCPVSVIQVKRDPGFCDGITYCFFVTAGNHSGQIASVNLRASAFDSRKTQHPLPFVYSIDKLAPDSPITRQFSTHRLQGSDYQGVKVWVADVQFSNGTLWKDDGRMICSGEDIRK
jgi:hypothetical protein